MEKLWNNQILLKFIFILILLSSCNSIKQAKVEVSIETFKTKEELKYSGEIMIIFQDKFNDMITIYRDKTELVTFFLKYKKSLSISLPYFIVKNNIANKNNIIKIFLKNTKEQLVIDKKGYCFAYIYKNSTGKYFVEYSNIPRSYY